MKFTLFILLTFVSSSCFAGWTLCNQASALNFVTTVNNALTEVHSFENMTGNISNDGVATLKVDLASINTHNSIRDQHVEKLIFDTKNFQELVITIKLSTEQMKVLTSETPSMITVNTTISLHGMEKEISADLLITKLQTGCLLVNSRHPIILSLDDFGLSDNLEKLRLLGKLSSITHKISVTFNLFYRKEGI